MVFYLKADFPLCDTSMACPEMEYDLQYLFKLEDEKMESKIEILSTINVEHSDDLYKIVDTLNRTLKRENLMFGLALDEENKNQAVFTIYRT